MSINSKKEQKLEFKPYVGRFFKFKVTKSSADVGRRVYGNRLLSKVSLDALPAVLLILDEKRNFVQFLAQNGDLLWTRKTHISPAKLPTYKGNPLPLLHDVYDFLVYCTDTRIGDFKVDTMTDKAKELLPKLTSLIEHYSKKHTMDKVE